MSFREIDTSAFEGTEFAIPKPKRRASTISRHLTPRANIRTRFDTEPAEPITGSRVAEKARGEKRSSIYVQTDKEYRRLMDLNSPPNTPRRGTSGFSIGTTPKRPKSTAHEKFRESMRKQRELAAMAERNRKALMDAEATSKYPRPDRDFGAVAKDVLRAHGVKDVRGIWAKSGLRIKQLLSSAHLSGDGYKKHEMDAIILAAKENAAAPEFTAPLLSEGTVSSATRAISVADPTDSPRTTPTPARVDEMMIDLEQKTPRDEDIKHALNVELPRREVPQTRTEAEIAAFDQKRARETDVQRMLSAKLMLRGDAPARPAWSSEQTIVELEEPHLTRLPNVTESEGHADLWDVETIATNPELAESLADAGSISTMERDQSVFELTGSVASFMPPLGHYSGHVGARFQEEKYEETPEARYMREHPDVPMRGRGGRVRRGRGRGRARTRHLPAERMRHFRAPQAAHRLAQRQNYMNAVYKSMRPKLLDTANRYAVTYSNNPVKQSMSLNFGSLLTRDRSINLRSGNIRASRGRAVIQCKRKTRADVKVITGFLRTEFPYGAKIGGSTFSLVALIPKVIKSLPGIVTITT